MWTSKKIWCFFSFINYHLCFSHLKHTKRLTMAQHFSQALTILCAMLSSLLSQRMCTCSNVSRPHFNSAVASVGIIDCPLPVFSVPCCLRFCYLTCTSQLNLNPLNFYISLLFYVYSYFIFFHFYVQSILWMQLLLNLGVAQCTAHAIY